MSKKSVDVSPITLTYDLHDLPSAQHRAGLAGLILQIEAMKKLDEKFIPGVEDISSTVAKITFTEQSTQGLFDFLYASSKEEERAFKKWSGSAEPKPGNFSITRKDPKTGADKEVPYFIYEVDVPKGRFLLRHLQQEASGWLKLWRRMIWTIPRGNPQSRAPFLEDPCSEGRKVWAQLIDLEKKKERGNTPTKPISGVLMLGAQAVNAEGIEFQGQVDQNLLLHFWQLVVLTYVPRVVNRKEKRLDRVGYVLSVPDVSDLNKFLGAFPRMLGSLPPADTTAGLPQEALIDLPAQGNLEVLKRLDSDPKRSSAETGARRTKRTGRGSIQTLADDKAGSESWGGGIHAVESYHMEKIGNNIKLHSYSRVSNRVGLVSAYERVVSNYRNPLFRALHLQALIQENSWHQGLIELFSSYPAPFFVTGDETPRFLPRFGKDASLMFRVMAQDALIMTDFDPKDMDAEERVKNLAYIVQRLVHAYVSRHAAERVGKEKSQFKVIEKAGKPKRIYGIEYLEARAKACTSVFLAMRSRHNQEFVDYFASSICSVPQVIPPRDFQFLTSILLQRSNQHPTERTSLCWEDVKALAMIAASASSYVPQTQSQDQGQ